MRYKIIDIKLKGQAKPAATKNLDPDIMHELLHRGMTHKNQMRLLVKLLEDVQLEYECVFGTGEHDEDGWGRLKTEEAQKVIDQLTHFYGLDEEDQD